MRVIAGSARGRKLKTAKNANVRPTADRVKEALFNIIASEVAGAKVLDLFAGTGNLGLEAISRDAAEAVLVDSSRVSVQMIRDNLERLNLNQRGRIIAAPVSRALRVLAEGGERFDIIFLDPPYGQNLVPQTLKNIARDNLLLSSGIIVAEHSVRDLVNYEYWPLKRVDQRRYGDTCLSFFRPSFETSVAQGNVNHGQ